MYHLDGASDGIDDVVVGAWGMVDCVCDQSFRPCAPVQWSAQSASRCAAVQCPRIQQRQEIVVEITFVVFGEIIR